MAAGIGGYNPGDLREVTTRPVQRIEAELVMLVFDRLNGVLASALRTKLLLGHLQIGHAVHLNNSTQFV